MEAQATVPGDSPGAGYVGRASALFPQVLDRAARKGSHFKASVHVQGCGRSTEFRAFGPFLGARRLVGLLSIQQPRLDAEAYGEFLFLSLQYCIFLHCAALCLCSIALTVLCHRCQSVVHFLHGLDPPSP